MQTLTVKLPELLADEIAREAKQRRVTKSQVVRERLTKGDAASPSAWDLMNDLVVTNDKLPRDLSSNKKHMKGYGQSRRRR